MNDLISVIVPVYNVEQYLSDCIKSILNQTYTNLELLLVDDGSTDNSGIICDEFSSVDNRIKVIHKINGGLSSARNVGIESASGDYYSFIDSDDYVEETFLECLYRKSLQENADICECSFFRLRMNKMTRERVFDYETLDHETAIRRLLAIPYESFVVIWNKLYRKKLFDKIRFPEGKLHEDEYTTYKLIYEANKVAYVNMNLYIYRIRDKSITNSEFNFKRLEVLDCIEEMESYFNKHNVNLNQELLFHQFAVQIILLNAMVDSNYFNKEIWKNIRENILIKRKELFKCPFLKKGHKLYIIALLSGHKTYAVFQKCVTVYKNYKEI